MFKKLVLPIFIFILAGCGEGKQVTEEMLIGNWHCSNTVNQGKSYDYDGKLEKNIDSVFGADYDLSYSLNNNELIETLNNEKSYSLDFNTKEILDFMPIGENKESYYDMEYVYVSDNKFKIIANAIDRYKSSKQKTFEQYTEVECSRITN